MYLFYFCYTAANDGQRRPTQVNEGQRRPTEGKTQVNEGPQRPTTANAGQRRSTKAHSSQRQPTTANAGQQRPTAANEGQRRPTQAHTFRPYVCFFFVFCSKLTILYKFYLAGCRPTQADKGPQQPMTANEGQRRPTKTKRGPNDASGVVWAIICFFSNVQSICYFFITSRSTCSCFFSNKPRSEPEPGLGRPWALY